MLQLMMISVTKNAALQIDVPGNVPSIRANKAQMRQVVMNLITNASDALRDQGGTIRVRLEHQHTQPEVAEKVCGKSLRRLRPVGDP